MQLKPTKQCSPGTIPEKVKNIMKTPGKFVTETQLAEILGLNVQKAVIMAAELKLSRIHVKKTRYYSKKQILAYLNK
jgi:hypothetical protein